MIIKGKTHTEFNNVAMASFDAQALRGAIYWYAGKGVAHTKKIFMYGRYPAISIYGEKLHIHRLLSMYYQDRALQPNEYIHHIDGNPLNSLPNNIEIQTASKHQSQANKGKKQSPAHINKRINATTQTRYGHSIYENEELK